MRGETHTSWPQPQPERWEDIDTQPPQSWPQPERWEDIAEILPEFEDAPPQPWGGI